MSASPIYIQQDLYCVGTTKSRKFSDWPRTKVIPFNYIVIIITTTTTIILITISITTTTLSPHYNYYHYSRLLSPGKSTKTTIH